MSVEGAKIEVDRSPLRCPYCHEGVNPDEPDWLACAGCLARHHNACWSELGRCGVCEKTETLERRSSPPVVTNPRPLETRPIGTSLKPGALDPKPASADSRAARAVAGALLASVLVGVAAFFFAGSRAYQGLKSARFQTPQVFGGPAAEASTDSLIFRVSIARDGSRVLADQVLSLNVYDASTGRLQRRVPHVGLAAAISPDGTTAVTVDSGDLCFHDLTTGRLAAQLPGGGLGTLVAFAPTTPPQIAFVSESMVRTARQVWSDSRGCYLWEMGKVIQKRTDVVCAIAFSPDAKQVYLGAQGSIVAVDLATGQEQPEPWEVDDRCGAGRWASHLAVAGDRVLGVGQFPAQVFDRREGESRHGQLLKDTLAPGVPEPAHDVEAAINADGLLGATIGSQAHDVKVWNLETRELVDRLDLEPSSDRPTSLAFTAEGALLVGTDRGVVLRFEPKDGAH